MKEKLSLVIAFAMLVPLAGCWEESPGPITVTSASLSGDMGGIRSFAVTPTDVVGWRDGYGLTNVTLEAITESGALVMGIIHFDDRVLEQEPGTTHSYSLESEPNEPFMDVMGCSGEDGMIDVDMPADQVDVTVEPSSTNPDERTVSFVATFESEYGTQRTHGSFDIAIPGGAGSTAPGN